MTDNDTYSAQPNAVYSSTVNSTYSEDGTTNWCIVLMTERDVANVATPSQVGSSVTRYLGLTPDYANCRYSDQVIQSNAKTNSTYEVDTHFDYDPYGNLKKTTSTGVSMSASVSPTTRITQSTWGSNTDNNGVTTLGQFPTQVIDADNQTTNQQFDNSTGLLQSSKDPNGVQTKYQYDNFGRISQLARPDGSSLSWVYHDCADTGFTCVNSKNKMVIAQTEYYSTGSAIRSTNTYLDRFERVLVRSDELFDGTFNRTEYQYDNRGNVLKQSAPCAWSNCSSPFWTSNTYDLLNRLTESQRPVDQSGTIQTTDYSYQGRIKTQQDPALNGVRPTTTTYMLVNGKVGRTVDAGNYQISFTYDAFGQFRTAIDGQNNTLKWARYAYGTGPFVIQSGSLDAGQYNYVVDAIGELVSYTDANGKGFSFTYDDLSRPVTRTEPDLPTTFTTTWTWGTSATAHEIGRLNSVTSASSSVYKEAYLYDSLGRLQRTTYTIPGLSGAQLIDFGYSSNSGKIETVTFPASYPAGFRQQERFGYQNGILQKVYDPANISTVWWLANSRNFRNQITTETLADSPSDPQIQSTRAYDSASGWLKNTTAGVGGGSGLQSAAYMYDVMGNLTQRQDYVSSQTENMFYDSMYRLDHSTVGSTTTQMHYDVMGNITSRSDVAGGATWVYDPTFKHRVTQAGDASHSYQYDANGNVIMRNGTTLSWTSYNYPSAVGTATESATFDYGPNRQRWRMVYTGPSGTETTYYMSRLFEVVGNSTGTTYRHYIYADGRPVAVIARSSAGVIARSLLTDHQGSISAIVPDSSGVSLVGESFTAFGNRRDATNWNNAPNTADQATMNGVTRQGYTFQTVLGSMGLNHMNGRVEDSITGRFLSIDQRWLRLFGQISLRDKWICLSG